MSFTPNTTLIEQLREAEHLLRDAQQDKKDQADNPVTARVAEHFDQSEKLITDTLDRLEEDLDEKTLKAYHQNEPADSPVERLQTHLPPPSDPAEFVNWSLARHEELAAWCETLSGKTVLGQTSELFGQLSESLRGLNRQLAADTRSLEQK